MGTSISSTSAPSLSALMSSVAASSTPKPSRWVQRGAVHGHISVQDEHIDAVARVLHLYVVVETFVEGKGTSVEPQRLFSGSSLSSSRVGRRMLEVICGAWPRPRLSGHSGLHIALCSGTPVTCREFHGLILTVAVGLLWRMPVPALITCTSPLRITGGGAHAVLVLQVASSGMETIPCYRAGAGAEAHAWRHGVVVQHAEHAEVHALGVVVVREAERVVAVQPAMIGVAAGGGFVEDGVCRGFGLPWVWGLRPPMFRRPQHCGDKAPGASWGLH